MQCPAGGYRVGDTAVGQPLEGVAGAIRQGGVAIEQGAVEIENYKVHDMP